MRRIIVVVRKRGEALMKTKVTEQGLLIRKEFLEGFDEVEIRKENHQLLIVPVSEEDPILQLGREPVLAEMDDASTHHDRYLYRTRAQYSSTLPLIASPSSS
jgi:hypothetical protein